MGGLLVGGFFEVGFFEVGLLVGGFFEMSWWTSICVQILHSFNGLSGFDVLWWGVIILVGGCGKHFDKKP